MTFQEAVAQYSDAKYGLIGDGLNPTDPSGNSMLYEGHYALVGRHVGLSSWTLGFNIGRAYQLLEVKPGLINRKPGATDPEAQDDYIGLTAAAVFADDRAYAQRVVSYGRANGWNYDNLSPDSNSIIDKLNQHFRYWHARLPGLTQHYKYCAGDELSQLGKLLWLAGAVGPALFHNGASGMLLSLLKIKAAPDNRYTRIAKRVFQWRLNRSYGGTIQGLYAAYFGEAHPFAVFSKGLAL
jgi:hypothetical protein